jgi:hypothetical protein
VPPEQVKPEGQTSGVAEALVAAPNAAVKIHRAKAILFIKNSTPYELFRSKFCKHWTNSGEKISSKNNRENGMCRLNNRKCNSFLQNHALTLAAIRPLYDTETCAALCSG